ncbi:MAG: hypothetical protein S0880_34670 [Actinomycetota bacterium]|nr:hypothetical protein [Actinomycetota bacterium]
MDDLNVSDPEPEVLHSRERRVLGTVGFVSLTSALVLAGSDVAMWLRAPLALALGGSGAVLLALATEVLRPDRRPGD